MTRDHVIVLPGGGYSRLSANESQPIVDWLESIGLSSSVFEYPVKTRHPAVLDAVRGEIRRQRDAGAERVGLIGFSAGGHLASSAGTRFGKALIDNRNNTSLRPDFMLLVYPRIILGDKERPGSVVKLIGENAPQELIDLYSTDRQVTGNTPPTFLVHAGDDRTAPVQNSLLFYQALLKHQVKAEMHIYQAGGHGFGLDNSTTPDVWFERCLNFLEQNKFLVR